MPNPGERWKLRNGHVVTIVGVANQHRHQADYPTTVVYRDTLDRLETRPLSIFGHAANPIENCRAIRLQDEMHCPPCRKRWDVKEDAPCES
jgi:hypothetical protein